MDKDNFLIEDNYLNLPRLYQFYNKLKTVFATKNEITNIKGDPGEQGVSVSKVEQTTLSSADGGTNVITVTLSDGTTSSFNIKNGSTGSAGAKGDTGTTPTIKAGTVTSLDSTASPTVSATTSDTTTTFNFGIPKGDTSDIKTPTFDDSVGTYSTLAAANTAAETASNAIKSKVSIFTTLSNMKKSFSAIVQGLKILGANVGAINGITDSLTSTSSNVAASAAAIKALNDKTTELNSKIDSFKILAKWEGYGSNEQFLPGTIHLCVSTTRQACAAALFTPIRNYKIIIKTDLLTGEVQQIETTDFMVDINLLRLSEGSYAFCVLVQLA